MNNLPINSMPAASAAASAAALANRSRWRFWLAGIIIFFLFLYLIRGILLPFVVGILTAYFLDPAVRRLTRRGLSRGAAAALITAAFFLVAIAGCALFAPLIVQQLAALASEMPGYVHTLRSNYGSDVERYFAKLGPDQADSVHDALNNFTATAAGMAGGMITNLLQSGLAIINLLSLVFLTPLVAFYLLRDWDVFIARMDAMLPRQYAHTIREQLHAIDLTLSGFIRGQTNVCLIMAAYYSIALLLVGLRFGLGLGILSGLLLFIPFIGFAACFIVAMAIALIQFGFTSSFFAVLVIYLVGMAVEGGFITPRLVGDKVGLHPLWIVFGMLAGGALFGLVGILIAVPVTAVIGVLVRFAMQRYLQSTLYNG